MKRLWYKLFNDYRPQSVLRANLGIYSRGDNSHELVAIVSKDQDGDYVIDSYPYGVRQIRTADKRKVIRLGLLTRLYLAYFAPIDFSFTGETNGQKEPT